MYAEILRILRSIWNFQMPKLRKKKYNICTLVHILKSKPSFEVSLSLSNAHFHSN